ncbi:uncharacterized protein G2W53_017911 [Senna tora]|uniref:Uncharacterized protein n=1 Tax=Senna tora TaxID=362788 RepID=A0A834WKW7_9FABA|nr:uncharacterized protein G2W53_017911 [Senna tora]
MSPIGCYGNAGKRVEKAAKEVMEFEEVGLGNSKKWVDANQMPTQKRPA